MSSGGSNMWTLGKRSGENSLNVSVKEYNGKTLVHIRHYFKIKDNDRWYVTRKGVALTLEEWDKFNESFVAIDAEVRRLRCKNEQVEPVPPTTVKRDFQSAFVGENE